MVLEVPMLCLLWRSAGSFVVEAEEESAETLGKKRVCHLWKKGQATWEEYKEVTRICKEKIRQKPSLKSTWPLQ